MALISLIAVVVVIVVVSFINYVNSTKKNQLPAGVQRLPGPKGKHWSARLFVLARLLTFLGYPILGSVPDVPQKQFPQIP